MGLLVYIRISFSALAIAGAVLLAGCSDSDSSGGGTNFNSPQEAAVATNLANLYADIGSGFSGAPKPGINVLKSLGYDEAAAKAAGLVTPNSDLTSSFCDSGDAHSTGDATGGSVSFSNCDDGAGFILDFTISWSTSGAVITVTIDGSMSFTVNSQTITITFNNYVVTTTDEGSGSYSMTINGTISISGTGTCHDNTFVFTTTTPIFYDGELGHTTAGVLQINNATITYNSDGSITLTVGGSSIDPTTVGYTCPA